MTSDLEQLNRFVTPAWPLSRMLELDTLWEAGTATAEMGRLLRCSKNAVIGKAHRMNLPSRPSPIHRRDVTTGAAPPKRTRPLETPRVKRKPTMATSGPPPQTPPPAKPPAAVFQRPARTCCWPMGEPRKPDFRFCGDAADPGKPYCTLHSRHAYVRIRRDDADRHV